MIWTSFDNFPPFVNDADRKCLGCGGVIRAGEVCRAKSYKLKGKPQTSVLHNLDCWQIWADKYWQRKASENER